MALRESDFRAERFSLEERLRWIARHGKGSFGLAPSAPGAPDPLLLEPQQADGRLTLNLNRCLALAPDGSLIHVDSTVPEDSGGTPPVTTVAPLAGGVDGRTLHVFVRASGPRFREHGSAAEDEPSRPRWCYADHELHVLDEIPSGAPDLLEIARFRVDGNEAIRLDSFIPPCLTVGSHPKLREKAEQMAGRFEHCRNTAIQLVERLAQERQERGEAALSAVPAEVFARNLAAVSIAVFSRIVDEGPRLAASDLVGVGRGFLREAQTFVEGHPELRRGRWERFLQSSGRINNHVTFRREVETRMQGPVPDHPIADALNPVLELVKLVTDFPSWLMGEDVDVPSPRSGETGEDYIYQGKTYYHVRYAEIRYQPRGEFHYLDFLGIPPKSGGRFLIYLRCEDADQRSLAGTLRCGGPDKRAYTFMGEQLPDTEHDSRAILLTLDLAPDQSFETIYVACRQENIDLSRLSAATGEDARLYHKP